MTIDNINENKMINLQDYGYRDDSSDHGDFIPARITELHRERYKVVCQHGECSATLIGSFYHETSSRKGYPAVGDFVLIRYNEQGESGIVKVLPRQSKFSRTDFSGRGSYAKTVYEQVVATNFDYVFIMVSLNRDFSLNRISRYLTAAWQSGGMPVVVLSKADLLDDFSDALEMTQSVARFVPIVVISTLTGFGLDELNEYLEPGKTVVFLGSSGVGKSSLLNCLAQREVMSTGEVRETDSRGRHTTTHRQMVRLPSGALVIDTPGLRELGLWNANESVSDRFSDIEELFCQCKFNDCSHTTELDCAIITALEEGILSEEEWQEYQMLKLEAVLMEDKAVYLRNKERRFKEIRKSMKKNKKHIKGEL